MDFINFAKELERKGSEHYTSIAEASTVKEISGIFKLLAREEQRHFDLFDALGSNRSMPPVDDPEISGEVNTIFAAMTQQFKNSGVPAFDHDEALEKALQFENESIRFYTEALTAASPEDTATKNLLTAILAQEHKHTRFITSLMEFLRHPGEWLENAEWHHTDVF
jgi:rubrerythrin